MVDGPGILDFFSPFLYYELQEKLLFSAPTFFSWRLSMKKILVALAALVILLAAGVLILFVFLNSIVEKAVNTEGPKLTGTPVHLEKVDISLLSGSGVFSGFTIGNPEGFSEGHAVSVGSVAVDLDTSTVLKDVIIIRKIDIDQPELVYELNKDTSNFDVLLQNIQKYADSHERKNDDSAGSADTADTEKAQRKVIIDELIIRNAKASLKVPMLKLSVKVPLPEIRLTDIGREGSGTSIARSALLVIKEISRTLAETTTTQTKKIGSTLIKEGENAGSKAKNLLKEGMGLFR